MYRIALDGPPGSGKSTLAKEIAKKMNIQYLDSGAIYRSFTLYCILNEVNTENEESILRALDDFKLDFSKNSVLINGKDYTDEIRKPYVSENVWKVAANKNVRAYVIKFCREYSKDNSVVMDGRDIGTDVFPDTPYKFFLVADLDVRTERRLKELREKGEKIEFDELKLMIAEREKTEKTRKVAPLVKHPNAIEIDTSNSGVDELLMLMIDYIKKIEGEVLSANNCS